MPRQARKNQDYSNYFHVIVKGNNDLDIFSNNTDKDKLLEIYKDQDWIKIFAYCIMSNHSHFLISVKEIEDLSKTMRRINQSYSFYYKKSNPNVDKIFEDRYWSMPIISTDQLFENLRYIHNNPIEANLVEDNLSYKNKLESYKYSSIKEYKENTKIIDKDFKNYVLETFGDYNNFINFHQVRQDYKDSFK